MCHVAQDSDYVLENYSVATLPSMATQRRYIDAIHAEDVVNQKEEEEFDKEMHAKAFLEQPKDLPRPINWNTRDDTFVRNRMSTIQKDEARLVQTPTITTKSKLNRAANIAGRFQDVPRPRSRIRELDGRPTFSSYQNQEDTINWKAKGKSRRWKDRSRSVPNQLKTIELSVKLTRGHLRAKKNQALLLRLEKEDVKDES